MNNWRTILKVSSISVGDPVKIKHEKGSLSFSRFKVISIEDNIAILEHIRGEESPHSKKIKQELPNKKVEVSKLVKNYDE